MAKAEKPQPEAQEAASAKKKPIILYIIIGVLSLVLLGGGGFAAYYFLIAKPHDEALQEETAQGHGDEHGKKEEKKPKKEGKDKHEKGKEGEGHKAVMVDVDPFVVNLVDPKARHYLKFAISIEVPDEAAKNTLTALMPRIKNDIIMLSSSKMMDDVILPDGKLRLKDEITSRVIAIAGSDVVTDVYIVQFVVQ